MKKYVLIIFILYAMALLTCDIPPPINLEYFTYSETKKTITITGYNGPGGIIRIPAAIKSKRVIAIGDNAFENKSLTNITIPNSITEIGEFAFFHNQLTSVTIPNKVTKIGEFAFSHNQLTSVTIPNKVTKIEEFAFSNNQLTNVIIPNSVTKIEMGAFSGNKLTSITIPKSITKIDYGAFYGNQLTSVAFRDITSSTNKIIGEKAFSNNQLTNVIIPNGVTDIYGEAFSNNQLTSVTIPNSVVVIGYKAFSNNQLTSVTIPNIVIDIGYEAFSNNRLTNVTIGTNVKLATGKGSSFGDGFEYAYNNCNKLMGTYTRPDTDTAWTGSNVTSKENDNNLFSDNNPLITKKILHDEIDLSPPNSNIMSNLSCSIHNQKLHQENILILYGLYDFDYRYGKLEREYFPNCNDPIWGGCIVRSQTYCSSYVCNECNKERDKYIMLRYDNGEPFALIY